MPEFSSQSLAQWTGGHWTGVPEKMEGLCHDTRKIVPGNLYLAFVGEQMDGHDYVSAAAEAGAVAAVVSRPMDIDLPQLVVEDTRRALCDLARGWRNTLDTVCVGITGSVGKTSVKECLADFLSSTGAVGRTPGNWNNDIGLPLSLLGIEPACTYAVLELGMNHPGEIAPLCELLQPLHGVMTEVGAAHAEAFDSIDAIADEKASLLRALPESGYAVLSRDDQFFDYFKGQTKARLLDVSMQSDDASYFGSACWHHPAQMEVCEKESGLRITYPMPMPGRFFMRNALKAIALARQLGVGPEAIHRALAVWQPPPMRWQRSRCLGRTVINDAYNANPISMAASLETFAEMRGQKWLVLGGMHELGALSDEAHAALGRRIAEGQWAGCLLVGEWGKLIAEGIPASPPFPVFPVENVSEAADCLARETHPGDMILLKASRGDGLERVLEYLNKVVAI